MHPKISLIVTVLNEEHTILRLLESIAHQRVAPAEIIIVDGGSSDTTLALIRSFATTHAQVPLLTKQKKGTRSVGRNAAIALAQYPLVACTDAGCVLDPNWLHELLQTYQKSQAQVVSGYYAAQPTSTFEAAVIPFVLVMPDKVNPQTFLPATRSLLLEKVVWKQLGGFDETLSDNEDYAFAKKIEHEKIPRAFAQKAVVFWSPPTSLIQFYHTLYRFARGDIFAGIVRPKVVLLFARYVVALTMVLVFAVVPSLQQLGLLFTAGAGSAYLIWALTKNYHYAPKSWMWFPVLQIVADVAVMSGSLAGFWQRQSKEAPPQ